MNPENPHGAERKSTVHYWDENWRRASGDETSPLLSRRDSYFWRRMDCLLTKSFAGLDTAKCSLIEIGAGASEWLPYLHHRFGFTVAGLDYSDVGCRRASENLARTSTPGRIYQADMFDPPPGLGQQFDVVVSLGLVEHFSDTASTLAACSAYAKPRGLILTLIPNIKGLYGWIYRLFDRRVYDIHVPLSLKELKRAHAEAGLEPLLDEYILGMPGVIDRDRDDPVAFRRLVRKVAFQFSRAVWALEERGWGMPENPFTSPYLVCVARKPSLTSGTGPSSRS